MNKKQLAIILSKLKRFENPKEYLEQYESDSEISAEILWELYLNNEIPEKVADFGAGTGILGIALLELGSSVTFIEKEADAIIDLKENLEGYEDYEIVEGDVLNNSSDFDLVVMNPPFGTRRKGADIEFLENATKHSKAILSMHLTVTKDYVIKYLEKRGFKVKKTWDVNFPIKASYEHHGAKISRKKVSIIYSKKHELN